MLNAPFPPLGAMTSRKLWWPHNEAMIAYALAFQHTRDAAHWERFRKVCRGREAWEREPART